LGAEVGLPVIDRDDIKDAVFDALGWSDRDWSQGVGLAAYEVLYLIAERLLASGVSVILDTNFRRDESLARLRDIRERHPCDVVEIHCRADPSVLARRFRERWQSGGRHPGHTAEFTDEGAFMSMLAKRGFYEAVALGAVVEVDTTDPEQIDWEGLRSTVRDASEGRDGSRDS
jgi:hypothetical protein